MKLGTRAALTAGALVVGSLGLWHGVDMATSNAATTSSKLKPCVGAVVKYDEYDDLNGVKWPCDVIPGQRLDMTMHISLSGETAVEAGGVCDQIGGELIMSKGEARDYDNGFKTTATCEGVDY